MPAKFTEEQRETLIDRLEAATADGRIRLSNEQFNAIFAVLFAEDFAPPLREAAKPTTTHSGVEHRVEVYAKRVERGEQLRHLRDAREFEHADDGWEIVARALSGGCVAAY